MPSSLGNRVHEFFSKFKRDKGAVRVDSEGGEVSQGDGSSLPAKQPPREVSIAQLKQGYGEVVDTMQAVRRHLDEQADRSDRMIHLLEGLPEVLKQLPEQNKSQIEMLRAMQGSMERQSETSLQLSSAIGSLSSVGEQQNKTMSEIQDHLVAEDEARRELSDGVKSLDSTLAEVRQSTDQSSQAVQNIADQARDRDAAIHEIFRRSQKTTSVLMIVAFGVGVLALALAAYIALQLPGVMNDSQATTPDATNTPAPITAPETPAIADTPALIETPAPIDNLDDIPPIEETPLEIEMLEQSLDEALQALSE